MREWTHGQSGRSIRVTWWHRWSLEFGHHGESGVLPRCETMGLTYSTSRAVLVTSSDLPVDPVFALHRGGKIEVRSTARVRDREGLALAYTPGVARVSEAIAADPGLADTYTWRANVVAVVSDGTAVLGLGNIGPLAALPVMEGKALLFKDFGGVDAVPIVLDTTDVDEIVDTVVRLAPSFGGINLEDISAPRCFEVERRLQERFDIPVFHDDQHGTAIVVLAALENAARLIDRPLSDLRVVVSGAGAAGVAVTRILLEAGIGDIAVGDSKGIIHTSRHDLNEMKQRIADATNTSRLSGSIEEALRGADVFVGVSAGTVREEASRLDVERRHGLCARQPGARGRSGGRVPARQGGGDRTQRLSEPDQQRPGVSRHLQGGTRGRRDRDHQGNEARGRGRACEGGRRRLRARPRHPECVRPTGEPVVAEAVGKAAHEDGVIRVHH